VRRYYRFSICIYTFYWFGFTVVCCGHINTIIFMKTVFVIIAKLFYVLALRLDFINFLLKCPAPMSQFSKLFGQLIHRQISTTITGATRCEILRLKCIKFDFCRGSFPDSARGIHSVPPYSLIGFKESCL